MEKKEKQTFLCIIQDKNSFGSGSESLIVAAEFYFSLLSVMIKRKNRSLSINVLKVL